MRQGRRRSNVDFAARGKCGNGAARPRFHLGGRAPGQIQFDRTTAVVSRSNFLRTVEFPTFVIDAPFSLDRLPRALARILALALLAVLLGACTFLRIGYPHLDTYAASVADDYFDLGLLTPGGDARTSFFKLQNWIQEAVADGRVAGQRPCRVCG